MKINTTQSIIGGIFAFFLSLSCCWLPFLIVAAGGASSLAAFSSGLENYSGILMSIGAGLIIWGGYQYCQKNNTTTMKEIQLQSMLTCPHCQVKKEEMMPTNACQFFYECTNCKTVLKPKAGDCCVYCSYGTVACPPIQEGNGCC